MVPGELTWLSDGAGRFLWGSPGWLAFTGAALAQGEGWLHLVHPADREPLERAIGTDAGGPPALHCRLRDGRTGDHRPLRVTLTPVDAGGDDGVTARVVIAHASAPPAEAAQPAPLSVEELDRLVAELRAAVATAGSGAVSAADLAMRLDGRLLAFHAVEILRRAGEGGVDLAFFLGERLGAGAGLCDGRIAVEGGEGVLLAREALHPLGAILETLRFDALDHGALAVPGGRLTVRATMEAAGGRPRLRLAWTEEAGVPLPAPDRRAVAGAWRTDRLAPPEIGLAVAADRTRVTVDLLFAPEVARQALADR